jgi:hypothetical protein
LAFDTTYSPVRKMGIMAGAKPGDRNRIHCVTPAICPRRGDVRGHKSGPVIVRLAQPLTEWGRTRGAGAVVISGVGRLAAAQRGQAGVSKPPSANGERGVANVLAGSGR